MTIVLSEDYVNLNIRAAVAGRDHCTGACETHSGCDCSAMQCPPCHGRCHQGRACNAQGASASSELLQDDDAERRLSLTSWFWTAYLGILLAAVCAGIAHFLPALSALVNN